jgi:O-antigen/teichoic acid export membrane protein
MKSRLSIGRRTLGAGAWVGGVHALSQVIRLLGNLALTRLLMPEAFGLMAVIFTLLMALNLLSDIGSGTVIVQSKRGADADFLNTAWTLQIIRGFAIWAMGLLLALGISIGQGQRLFIADTVYDDPRLPLLLAVSLLMMVIRGFASVNGMLAQRNLELKVVSILELTSQVVSLVFMLIVAYYTQSVWALVAGSLVGAAAQSSLSHALLKGPRPRLTMEREAMQELLSKGKWVLVSSLLGFVAMNGDRVLLGGLINGTTLGLYSIAVGLAGIAPAVLSMLLAKVVFPVFSEVVRDRPSELRVTYRKFQLGIDAILGLLAGFFYITSEGIIALLYDARYQGAGHIFGVLALGTIGVRFFVVEQIYTAMGRTSLLAVAIFPRVVVLLLGVPMGYALWQMNGALYAIVLSQFAHWPIAIWFRSTQGLEQFRNDFMLPVGLCLGLGGGWGLVRLVQLVTT